MILDTSALFAYFVSTDPHHRAVSEVVDGEVEAGTRLVVSPFVIAELDYLILTRFGAKAERAVLDELAGGAWTIAQIQPEDLIVISRLTARYADLRIGATDASLVVLADREATLRIATLDYRHFAALRSLDGEQFQLLPAPA